MKFLIGSVAAFVMSLILAVVLFSFSDFDSLKKNYYSGKFNFNKNFNFNVGIEEEDDWEEKTFNFEAIKINKILISSVASKVLISSSNRDDVLLKVKTKKEDLDNNFSAEIESGVLNITDGKGKEDKSLSSLFGKDGSDGIIINLEVPQSWKSSYELEVAFGEIKVDRIKGNLFKVEVAAGDLEVSDVEFKDLKIEAAAGDIDLENITLGKGSIEAAAGDIDLKGIKSEEEFVVKAAAGDIDLEMNQTSPKVKISAAAGDIDFSLSKGLEYNFTFENSTTVGSLDLNPPHTNKGKLSIFGNGEGSVEVETTFGDVEVN